MNLFHSLLALDSSLCTRINIKLLNKACSFYSLTATHLFKLPFLAFPPYIYSIIATKLLSFSWMLLFLCPISLLTTPFSACIVPFIFHTHCRFSQSRKGMHFSSSSSNLFSSMKLFESHASIVTWPPVLFFQVLWFILLLLHSWHCIIII